MLLAVLCTHMTRMKSNARSFPNHPTQHIIIFLINSVVLGIPNRVS